MIKKLGYKILFVLLIVVILNFVYTYTLFETDLRLKSDKAIEVKELNKSEMDVIYISDCSNTNTIETDSIKTSVLQNINLFFPDLKMRSIDMAASHAGIFKYWLREFDFKIKKPKCIIVTVNMRSFNAAWINSDLETALQESIVLLKPYPNLLNRFLLSLKNYDFKTKSEREKLVENDWRTQPLNFPYKTNYNSVKIWDSIMANGTYLLPNGSWDFEKISLACHYIKAFAFTINEANPRIKDYDEIATWAFNNEIQLYYNLIPENIEYADSLVNKDLLFLMRRNAKFIVDRYTKDNCKVLNNMELLKGEEFTEKNWTTEHYRYRGRMYLARNVALGIKNQFENKYIKKY